MIPYVWCTYRRWSFQVLESLLNMDVARPAMIVTTPDCMYEFARFERHGIEIVRENPKQAFRPGAAALSAIKRLAPACVFFYGWSWLVPADVHDRYLCLTMHPGKLPDDRGGSPLQNQIRAGEEWTYANIIGLVRQLDAGDIFARERFSLSGDIEDVWARMVATGSVMTRRFLSDLAGDRLQRTPQPSEGRIYRRVTPEDAELHPERQTARQMYDIIRAHNESDPNSYVKPAFVRSGELAYVISAAVLEGEHVDRTRERFRFDAPGVDLYAICKRVNDADAYLVVQAADGRAVLVSRYYVSAVRLR